MHMVLPADSDSCLMLGHIHAEHDGLLILVLYSRTVLYSSIYAYNVSR